MSTHAQARPVAGKIIDFPVLALLAIFGIGAVVIAYRFVAGIGAVSNMNDGYAWGIWEPVNVVVFTGIGAGAYSVGLLCYLLGKGEYHPLVRPSVLLGAIAYTLGGSSIVVALGRYWNMYWLALPSMWNVSSVLLEVAVCVCLYVCVLWIEVLPAVLERAAASRSPGWAARGRRWGARLALAMPYIIALAMLLPTMHQSSLGGLLLIAGTKVHALWHTPLLPLLALVSCLSMGFGAVVVLVTLMNRTWRAALEPRLLRALCLANGGFLLLYVGLRLGDLALAGKLHLLARADWHAGLFAVELAFFVLPALMFFSSRVRSSRPALLLGAMMAVAAGALWRLDAFITCFDPGAGYTYFPSYGEIAVTVGMAALGGAVFAIVSRLVPVVELAEPASHAVHGAGEREALARG